jgi:hypothetical protein
LPFATVCLCLLALAALLGGNAPSAGAEEACPNEAIREEQHSTYLPDCRAYELVSPQDKNGGEVAPESSRTRAAADGSAVQFASKSAFAEPSGTGIAVDYISERTAAASTRGWATHAITPHQEPLALSEIIFGPLDTGYQGEFSSDLNRGVFLAKSNIGTEGANVAKVPKLYLRDDLLASGPGHYTLLSDCPACSGPLTVSGPNVQPQFAGASADFSHVIFETSVDLTDDATGDEAKLYEWTQGTVRLVGLVPPRAESQCGPAPLQPCQPTPSSGAGQGGAPDGYLKFYTRDTISTDGDRVVFSSPVDEFQEAPRSLYLREAHATTVKLNSSERTGCPADPSCDDGSTHFGDSTPDLSRIYFVDSAQLTDQSGGGLYVYDSTKPASDPHNLQLLASVSNGGVVGVSEDGSYVYFISSSAVGSDSHDCQGQFPCLYLWHQGDLRFVATIDGDFSNHDSESAEIAGRYWNGNTKGARISADGKELLFRSMGSPTEQPPYDHGGSCSGPSFHFAETPTCPEVYLYSATAAGGQGDLTCVSCNPAGSATSGRITQFNLLEGLGSHSAHLNRALSSDGRYTFFSTAEPLVSADTNVAYDVYQYDSVSDQVSLISSGTSPVDSFFLEAGADGRDVFFRTAQRLNGWDRDELSDLYDARVGGGFAEPAAPIQCSGDSCQHPSTSAPRPPSPLTTSPGPGNPPRRCPRGRVRRHRRCASRHRSRKTHHHRAGQVHSERRASR